MVPSVLNDKPFHEEIITQENESVNKQAHKLSITNGRMRSLPRLKTAPHNRRMLMVMYRIKQETLTNIPKKSTMILDGRGQMTF